LAGLRVEQLDLGRARLTVNQAASWVRGRLTFGPPKTRASRRTVTLPAFLVDGLRQHLSAYGWAGGLVFTSPESRPLHWTYSRRRHWKPAVEASVGEPCRFHDLRHTHAALLIAAGEHSKVIQQRLGHASIRTTLDVYGHLFDGLDEDATDRLDLIAAQHLAASPRPGG
jgi:integrase